MRRALPALAVVLLVALSGCNALLASAHRYPPGVTASDVRDGTALADAHANHLRRGYRVHTVSTYVAPNGTVLQRVETRARWSPTRATRTTTFRAQHALLGVRAEIYVNATAAFLRTHGANGTVTTTRFAERPRPITVQGPDTAWNVIYRLVGAQNATVTALANGTTRVRVTNAQVGTSTGTGTLYVTPAGFVTRYEVTFENEYRGRTVTVHRTVDYSHVGTPDVEKPAWVANAST